MWAEGQALWRVGLLEAPRLEVFNDLAELMVLAAQGKVVLHTSVYKLADFQKALDDLAAGKVRGRAILVP